jgi:hypothetical protein
MDLSETGEVRWMEQSHDRVQSRTSGSSTSSTSSTLPESYSIYCATFISEFGSDQYVYFVSNVRHRFRRSLPCSINLNLSKTLNDIP